MLGSTYYSESFGYNADHTRRVSRASGGTTTNFQYAGDSVLLEKQGSTTTATYTYGNALIRKDGETPLYDGLGTARVETNSSQAVTFTQIPDAFGNTAAATGSTASSYGFAATSGYRTDGDAGLMKVGCRYYDPQVGSFTTRDTCLDQKPYLYCEHDPVNSADPTGHQAYIVDPPGNKGIYNPPPEEGYPGGIRGPDGVNWTYIEEPVPTPTPPISRWHRFWKFIRLIPEAIGDVFDKWADPIFLLPVPINPLGLHKYVGEA